MIDRQRFAQIPPGWPHTQGSNRHPSRRPRLEGRLAQAPAAAPLGSKLKECLQDSPAKGTDANEGRTKGGERERGPQPRAPRKGPGHLLPAGHTFRLHSLEVTGQGTPGPQPPRTGRLAPHFCQRSSKPVSRRSHTRVHTPPTP